MPPVNPPAIYSQLDLKKATVKDINDVELWYLFKMAELTEVISQRGDTRLIVTLNKVRVGGVDDAAEFFLKSRLAVQKKFHIQLILSICLLKMPLQMHKTNLRLSSLINYDYSQIEFLEVIM